MAIVMLAFMWPMYSGKTTKVAVIVAAAAVASGLLAINRSQGLIEDEAFMQAMIPHHSIAINNARKARISAPRVRRLADEIISSQVREIREMQLLIDDIENHGRRSNQALPARKAILTPEMKDEIDQAIR